MKTQNPPVCDYEGSDYQKSFWDSGGREYEDQVEAIALKRLLPEQGELLLELGAGAGRNTPRYRTQLEQAQERLGNSSHYVYVAADIYNLPFVPALFDAATMIRTLHHMAEPSMALHQVRQTLKQNAVFILEFANKRNLKSLLRYLLRRQPWNPFSLEPVEFVALNFDFHPQAVRNWLEENNFVIEKQLTVSHFRQGLLKKVVPLQLLVQMDAMAQYTGNWWQYTPSVFVKAIASGGADTPTEGGFFRCPKCGNHALEEAEDGLYCSSCASLWELRDGIYDFRQPVGRD